MLWSRSCIIYQHSRWNKFQISFHTKVQNQNFAFYHFKNVVDADRSVNHEICSDEIFLRSESAIQTTISRYDRRFTAFLQHLSNAVPDLFAVNWQKENIKMLIIKAQVSLVDGKYVPIKYFESYVSKIQVYIFSNLVIIIKSIRNLSAII